MNEVSSSLAKHSPASDKHSLACLLSHFEAEFPTEEDCLTELFKIAHIRIQCHSCQSRNIEVHENRRAGKCLECYKETWFTAGTFLEHMKKPKPRLAAIWLMTKGAILKSTTFATLLDVVQSTAFEILKWARFAIQCNLPENADFVDSSFFSSMFNKRSLETPARAHPRSEQDEMEKMSSAVDPPGSSAALANQQCSPEEAEILQLISEKPIHTNEIIERSNLPIGSVLAGLTMLELNEQIQRLAGDRYARCKLKPKLHSLKKELSETIGSFLDFIRTNYGGISRRYLQSYIAAFWCYFLNSQYSQDEILHICFRHLPLSDRKLSSYVTPLAVKIIIAPPAGNCDAPIRHCFV